MRAPVFRPGEVNRRDGGDLVVVLSFLKGLEKFPEGVLASLSAFTPALEAVQADAARPASNREIIPGSDERADFILERRCQLGWFALAWDGWQRIEIV